MTYATDILFPAQEIQYTYFIFAFWGRRWVSMKEFCVCVCGNIIVSHFNTLCRLKFWRYSDCDVLIFHVTFIGIFYVGWLNKNFFLSLHFKNLYEIRWYNLKLFFNLITDVDKFKENLTVKVIWRCKFIPVCKWTSIFILRINS